MRSNFLYWVFAFVLLTGMLSSCKKGSSGGGGGGGGGGEATLNVTINPPVNSVQPAAPQADFPVSVTINSAMPPQGVTIVVSAKKDDGSGAPDFFSTSLVTSNATNNFTITNTPVSVVCVATVTVTSRTSATNTWTGTFRFSRKP